MFDRAHFVPERLTPVVLGAVFHGEFAVNMATVDHYSNHSAKASSPPEIDRDMQRALYELTPAEDSYHWPNKALNVEWSRAFLLGYLHHHLLVDIVKYGVRHTFGDCPCDFFSEIPDNQKSASFAVNAPWWSIHDGQDAGTYLVIDLAVAQGWPNLKFSPFGCVPKAGADPLLEARLIHDLSYPKGKSPNSSSDRDKLPSILYIRVQVIARRIEVLRKRYPHQRVKMLKGDVKRAFRQIMLAAEISRWFCGKIPADKAAVVDIALPFGVTQTDAKTRSLRAQWRAPVEHLRGRLEIEK
ncbi:hypothetical protein ON010_g18882 [Phytophthora cinnamomi]|nr:hypothetical protein ON010_g18882 [Phytophthora cinnamomi]